MPQLNLMNLAELIAYCYDHQPDLYACLSPETTRADLLAMLEQKTMTPNKTHSHFTGRDKELQAVQNQLNSRPLVAIIGLGGMGKTTLALELIEVLRDKNRYQAEVWTSAKYTQFSGEGIQSDSPSATAESLDQLVGEIIRQAVPTARTETPAQKRETARRWLADHPTLIILDNFETVKEAVAVAMLQGLRQILGQGQVLITSRHRVKYELVSQIELHSLNEANSLKFLRHEARNRHVAAVEQANLAELTKIYHACGGQPLAMRLVVGQLSRLSLRRVLGYLAQPRPDSETYSLYRFIYQFSWDMLTHSAQHLLVAMGAQENNVALFADDLEIITAEHVTPESFDRAIDQLIHLSLVEVTGGLEKQYQLHPLTYQFIKSEITQEW
ncbi:ATP-binding protein [Anaerolineales bacterium HSG6]|nr:ATP-binding protein [Anaerolineales bacterium HSG6]